MAAESAPDKPILFEEAAEFAKVLSTIPNASKVLTDLSEHGVAVPATTLGVSVHFLSKVVAEIEAIKSIRAASRRALDIAALVRAAVHHDRAEWDEAARALVNDSKWTVETIASAKPDALNATIGSPAGWLPQYTEGLIHAAKRFVSRLQEADKRLGGAARATALWERLAEIEAATSAATSRINADSGAVQAAITGHKARLVQELWMAVRNRLQVALPGPGGALGPAASWQDGWLKYEAPDLAPVLEQAATFGYVGHEQVAEAQSAQ